MREISLLDSADGVWEGASRKYDHTKYEFLAQTLADNCEEDKEERKKSVRRKRGEWKMRGKFLEE